MQEARGADPAPLLEGLAVHQGHLTSWATEAEPAYRRPHARGFRQTDGVVGCLCRSGPGPPARNADHGCASVGSSGFPDGGLRIQRRSKSMRQILRLAGAPEVGEIEVQMLADHMAVQRHDVDTRLAQRMQDRLHFLGTHDEVAVHCRGCIAATERSPGRQAHRSAHDHALHRAGAPDRKSTRLNSSHVEISYAVFCLKKKKTNISLILFSTSFTIRYVSFLT